MKGTREEANTLPQSHDYVIEDRKKVRKMVQEPSTGILWNIH